MMASTYSSQKIAKELGRRFGDAAKTIKVDMKYTKEFNHFINKVESAQRKTAGSKLMFK
jgi:hypothetical protein